MPTTRTRKGRTNTPSLLVIATLGVGCGISGMPENELRDMWQEYGQAVIDHYDRQGWGEPFVAEIARQEGWE
ncbi:MAG: hypothetical protein WB870_06830 [Gallionellaceae bacterium]